MLGVLKQLLKTASNPDGIVAVFYRSLAVLLSKLLMIMFQQSLKVPSEWKLSHVIPLFKGKGDRVDAESYHAISLTPSISKIMERIIFEQLQQFMEANGMITDAQHGCKAARSCATNLLSFDSDLASMLNDGITIDVISLDIARAFDSVNHCILINKLQRIGIEKPMLGWLTFFQDGNSVIINGAVSEAVIGMTSGVAAGSAIGPLLFVVMINDFPAVIHYCIRYMFADDVNLLGKRAVVYSREFI